ncbi:Down syndrome cell adhesion molecule-like protein Dscam2 [Nymphon striatum]|nr:Down syndrome cell adhesion molecule-like protein Dscam2 [Nymphon striatum]
MLYTENKRHLFAVVCYCNNDRMQKCVQKLPTSFNDASRGSRSTSIEWLLPINSMNGVFTLLSFTAMMRRVEGQYSDNRKQGPVFFIEPKKDIEFMNTVGTRLDCSAHGNPSPQQRWRTTQGLDVFPVPGLIKLTSNGSLVLLPFSSNTYRQDIHAADYVCYATNIYGTIRSVSVNVRAVMEQIYQGQVYDEYVIRKNTAVFKCQLPSFVRDDVIVTNWMVNGDVIHPQDLKYAMFPSGKLHILNVNENDDMKQFRCETRHRLNGAVHISSEYGTLHVTESRSSIQPQKGHHEQVVYAQEGSDIGLPCAAQSFPPPQYTWLREDESKILRPLIEWKKVSLRGGSLMLRDVKEEDSGGYQCYINNTLGHLALKTRLIVTAPLRAYIDNQKQVADVGKIVNLTCTVSGYPVDNIKWRLNSEDIVVDRRIYNHGKVLTIKRIERKDAGMYQCFVKNDLQTVQATAQLLLGANFLFSYAASPLEAERLRNDVHKMIREFLTFIYNSVGEFHTNALYRSATMMSHND